MIDRRDFLRLGVVGAGAVFASGLPRTAGAAKAGSDFYFVQLSDAHWGYRGPANPQSQDALPNAVAIVNSLPVQPDFIVFTGDLTHTTDDPAERRTRLSQVKQIVDGLKVKTRHFLPGEHDASLDNGAAFKEFFGPSNYTFDHKGVHFSPGRRCKSR